MSFTKTIGILGGMGPSASAAMYQKIIHLCQEQYGAVQDTDYPKIVLYSLPLTGFDETGIVDASHVSQQLHSGIAKLVAAGCGRTFCSWRPLVLYDDENGAVLPCTARTRNARRNAKFESPGCNYQYH